MNNIYRKEELEILRGQWGEECHTFYPSDQEKYIGFGDVVQLSTLTLFPNTYKEGMKLYRNLEVVNIVFSGEVTYQDGLGTVSSFPKNTVQVISPGSGVYQVESNKSSEILKLIQIGILPSRINTIPIRTHAIFNLEQYANSFVELISPTPGPASLSLHQNTAILLGKFDTDRHIGYHIQENDVGLLIYVVQGEIMINRRLVLSGESCGILSAHDVMVHTEADSIILLIETILQRREQDSDYIYG